VFTDADLATPIEYVQDARDLLEEGWDLVIGSREGNGARRIGEPRHRHYMGRLYNYFVQALLLPGIRDTQCGFKAFRYDVARDLFTRTALYHGTDLRVRGPLVTGFDVELLYLARRRGYRIFELPVVWRHVSGSKVRPGVDSMLMLRDVLRVRWNGLRGRYDWLIAHVADECWMTWAVKSQRESDMRGRLEKFTTGDILQLYFSSSNRTSVDHIRRLRSRRFVEPV
jgi:dolichyl-phosphate beta-glucosyltransferase